MGFQGHQVTEQRTTCSALEWRERLKRKIWTQNVGTGFPNAEQGRFPSEGIASAWYLGAEIRQQVKAAGAQRSWRQR